MERVVLLVISLLCFTSCLKAPAVDGSTSLSSSACSGSTDVLRPPPGVPTLAAHTKLDPEILKWTRRFTPRSSPREQNLLSAFASTQDDRLPEGARLVALVDHACTERMGYSLHSFKGREISREIMSNSVASVWRGRGMKLRAHSWSPARAMSARELKKIADHDLCLVALSPELEFFRNSTVTNDPLLSSQTHLSAIHAAESYDIFYNATTGLTSDVTVAVIDDGVSITHPDLSAQVWVNSSETAGNGIDDDGNGYIDDVNGWNFASDIASPEPQGSSSHGTHVAGLAAAAADNTVGGAGVIGQHAKIMGLNVFGSSGSASITRVINAILYASENGADVINLSLGGAGRSTALESALRSAISAGVVVLAAAGNDGEELVSSYAPAGYAAEMDGMISVGSIDVATDAMSSFSNFSSSLVEIAAPGSDSENGGLVSTIPGSAYAYKQGTSMAAPLVAGAAALAIGIRKSRGDGYTPAQIESLLEETSTTSAALDGLVSGCRSLDLETLANSL